MEECLFRAVPLSLAALIGQRYGHRGAAIAIAVVVQALVFGGGHASYPGFPSYSRLVELFVPAILWALIFLRFGLMPTILLHALFDLALMSMPLFLIDAPGALLSRAPRHRSGARAARDRARASLRARIMGRASRRASQRRVAATGGRSTGTSRFACSGRHRGRRPRRNVSARAACARRHRHSGVGAGDTVSRRRARAGVIARRRRAYRRAPRSSRTASRLDPIGGGVRSCGSRPTIPRAGRATSSSGAKPGATAYAKLIGNVLVPPHWEVRYARFEGDVAERAEEWRVTIDGRGEVRQIRHALPESRPGAHLARDDALALARKTVRERFGLDPSALKEVGAEEKQLPARVDWTFTFADPAAVVGADGEARIVVAVAGDEVVGVRPLRPCPRIVATRRARARRQDAVRAHGAGRAARNLRVRRAHHGRDRLDASSPRRARADGRRRDRVRPERRRRREFVASARDELQHDRAAGHAMGLRRRRRAGRGARLGAAAWARSRCGRVCCGSRAKARAPFRRPGMGGRRRRRLLRRRRWGDRDALAAEIGPGMAGVRHRVARVAVARRRARGRSRALWDRRRLVPAALVRAIDGRLAAPRLADRVHRDRDLRDAWACRCSRRGRRGCRRARSPAPRWSRSSMRCCASTPLQSRRLSRPVLCSISSRARCARATPERIVYAAHRDRSHRRRGVGGDELPAARAGYRRGVGCEIAGPGSPPAIVT